MAESMVDNVELVGRLVGANKIVEKQYCEKV